MFKICWHRWTAEVINESVHIEVCARCGKRRHVVPPSAVAVDCWWLMTGRWVTTPIVIPGEEPYDHHD